MILSFISFIPALIFNNGYIVAIAMLVGILADVIFNISMCIYEDKHKDKHEDKHGGEDKHYSKDIK